MFVQTTDFPPLRAEDGTNGARPEDIRQESGGVYRIVVDCVAPGAHCSPHDLDYLLLRRIELITETRLNLPILAHDLHNIFTTAIPATHVNFRDLDTGRKN